MTDPITYVIKNVVEDSNLSISRYAQLLGVPHDILAYFAVRLALVPL